MKKAIPDAKNINKLRKILIENRVLKTLFPIIIF